jgi:hypothetical protein
VLNTYRTGDDASRQRAITTVRPLRRLAQPRITAVQADVDIDPAHRHLVAHMTLGTGTTRRSASCTSTPIPIHHLAGVRPHDTVKVDNRLGYAIYRLTPLAPGLDAVRRHARLCAEGHQRAAGFPRPQRHVLRTVLPRFGYQPDNQLTDRSTRRKLGLKEDLPRMPRLGDEAARQHLHRQRLGLIHFDTTIATANDQIAMAPGYLQKAWQAGGALFRYVMDRPADFFLDSGRYAAKRIAGTTRWRSYNPAHGWNVDDMLQSAKDALAYYEAHFSPYQFRQLRILEFPNYAGFAQSFANTIPFSESVGFIADLRDPSKIDYAYYVTAHEVAHQWWAHQVIGANMQGPRCSASRWCALGADGDEAQVRRRPDAPLPRP